jgi:type II secretion system protein G
MFNSINNIKKHSAGFTLIELLVVVAIIGLLSSVVLASLNTARGKARDAKAKEEFHSLQQALAFYYDKYGKYPNETPVTTNMWTDNFNSMATQLVTEKFLSAVPVAPANHSYNYYNYGGTIGGLLVTNLETVTAQTAAYPGTCRPFSTGNWCDTTVSSNYYCICNPY